MPVAFFELTEGILSEELVGEVDGLGVGVGESVVGVGVLDAVEESERRSGKDAGAAWVEDEPDLALPGLAGIDVAVFKAEWVGSARGGLTDGARACAPEVSVEGVFVGV